MSGDECDVSYDFKSLGSGAEVWESTGLHRDCSFNLGEFYSGYLLWILAGTQVDQGVLVYDYDDWSGDFTHHPSPEISYAGLETCEGVDVCVDGIECCGPCDPWVADVWI